MLEPLEEAGRKACLGRKRVYAVQDTTESDFSHRQAVEELGPIHTSENPGQGILLHPALALDEEGTPIGYLGIQTWTRDAAQKKKREKRKTLPVEEK